MDVRGGVAWVIIMAVHSLNDGINGLIGGTSKADLNPDLTTWAQAWPAWQGVPHRGDHSRRAVFPVPLLCAGTGAAERNRG